MSKDIKTLEAALESNAALEKKVEELEKEIATQDELIADLRYQLKKVKAETKDATKNVVVEHEKKQYKVVAHSFTHGDQIITKEELAKNKELIKELVDSGSGFLQEVK